LNAAWAAASEDMYKATQEASANVAPGAEANAPNNEAVQDVDFEEVKDEKK
jgi:molecular chaperone DnaK